MARLVEAEIVSPYSGILINTDVGNPTAPLIAVLGRQASFIRLVGTHGFFHPYKGIKIYPFTYAFFLLCLSIYANSSSSAQVRTSHLNLLQLCPEWEASGWPPPL